MMCCPFLHSLAFHIISPTLSLQYPHPQTTPTAHHAQATPQAQKKDLELFHTLNGIDPANSHPRKAKIPENFKPLFQPPPNSWPERSVILPSMTLLFSNIANNSNASKTTTTTGS